MSTELWLDSHLMSLRNKAAMRRLLQNALSRTATSGGFTLADLGILPSGARKGWQDPHVNTSVVVWHLLVGTYFLGSNAMLVVSSPEVPHDKIWVKPNLRLLSSHLKAESGSSPEKEAEKRQHKPETQDGAQPFFALLPSSTCPSWPCSWG